jgi:hypothetical protein
VKKHEMNAVASMHEKEPFVPVNICPGRPGRKPHEKVAKGPQYLNKSEYIRWGPQAVRMIDER